MTLFVTLGDLTGIDLSVVVFAIFGIAIISVWWRERKARKPKSEVPKKLPRSIDARVWADEWLEVTAKYPQIPTCRDTMITWFSNAIMAGYDEAMRRSAKEARK